MQICVTDGDYDAYGSKYGDDKYGAEGSKYGEEASKYGEDATKYGDESHADEKYHHLRFLMAAAEGDGPCPKGREPFWSRNALHNTHLLIFLVAVTHIVYTALSLTLAHWKVRV